MSRRGPPVDRRRRVEEAVAGEDVTGSTLQDVDGRLVDQVGDAVSQADVPDHLEVIKVYMLALLEVRQTT